MKKEVIKKEKRKLPRFGVLDAVIILLVIVAAIGIYFRYDVVDLLKSRQNAENFVVTFSVENIHPYTPEYLNLNDSVYISDSGELLGTLISESDASELPYNITPASEILTFNGEPVEVNYPDSNTRVNIKGRISCHGVTAENGAVLVNGASYLASGQALNVYTESVSVCIQILEIEKV